MERLYKEEWVRISAVLASVIIAFAGLSFLAGWLVRLPPEESGQPHLNQIHYRWRNDDGDERTATWAAAEDMSVTGIGKFTTYRLRYEVVNQGSSTSYAVRYQFEYALSTEGPWSVVGPWGATSHWVIWDSPHIVDGAATENLSDGLTDAGAHFVSGQIRDQGNTTDPITLPPNSFTEIEFSVRATSTALDAATYHFRLTDSGNPFDLLEAKPKRESKVYFRTATGELKKRISR
ncbi:MAG: hypothetical protein A2939_00940 [Parcubacteria group bacterium RIFCSPLOWO2_01_FULL_48_18]|nr:MAG: hypothetical protein A3J67_04825 [Parcubacteria group bacterium RIFCSPHIGHO2_02_FULL_48_10b]OHB22040.1 MAG: hypothetical protein A2939_00940 [Parcubacteria group bacterium RIFCSPLOWO2_01_FULL_48_18]